MHASVCFFRTEGSVSKLTHPVNGRQRRNGRQGPQEVLGPTRVSARPKGAALPEQGDLHPRRRHLLSAYYRGDLQTVRIENVIYLQADHKYVKVRHGGGEILLDESLRSLEEEFPDLLLRVHRNALVAKSRLAGLAMGLGGKVQVRLRDCPEQLPVSQRHLSCIRRMLLNGYDGALHGPDFQLGHSMLAHLTVALPIEIRDRLKQASEQTGENVARIVGRALSKELELLRR